MHLVTTVTLATLGAAARAPTTAERLRPNLLLDVAGVGVPEDSWIGYLLRAGSVELRIVGRAQRCVMVNHAQATLPARRDVLKAIGQANGAYAGVYAEVCASGTVRVGNPVTLIGS